MDMRHATETMAGRALPIGSVVAQSFRVFAKAPSFFLFVSLLCTAPVVVQHMTLKPVPRENIGPLLIAIFVQYGVLFATAAPVAVATVHILDGERPRVGRAVAISFRRSIPIFFTVLIGLIIQLLGLVLLIVPGVIVAAAFVPTVPICVLEHLGPVASLKRSMVLTKGSRWRILAKWGYGAGDLVQVVVLAVALVVNTVIYRALLPIAQKIEARAVSNVFA